MDHPVNERMGKAPRVKRRRWLFVFLAVAIIVSIFLVAAIILSRTSIHAEESVFYAPEEIQFIFILTALAFLLAVGLLISAVARRNRELGREIEEMKKKMPSPAQMEVINSFDVAARPEEKEKKAKYEQMMAQVTERLAQLQ